MNPASNMKGGKGGGGIPNTGGGGPGPQSPGSIPAAPSDILAAEVMFFNVDLQKNEKKNDEKWCIG